MKRFLVALACVLCLPLAAAAIPLGSAEVARLVQDSPPLEEYKGEHAVIWRRNLTYSKDSDGRTVCSTSVAVLCDAAARLEWLTDQLYAPDGGRIELEQAAFFDPGTAKLLHNLTFSAAERDHYGRIVLDVPKMDDVYLFVLSYRQYFAEKDNLEGLVWLGAEYPVWEGSVQVRLPKGEELLYQSSSNSAPTKRDDSRFSWYSWYYFKQPANRGIVGILDSSDSYVVFSQRKGFLSTLNALKSMASRRWSGIPARYAVSKGSVKERALKTIESFWFSPSRLPVSGVWRSPSMIPSDGPWTTWEAYYVAAAWLKSQGWKAEVWFQNVVPLDKKCVTAAAALMRPVLYLTEPGGRKGWYYIPGQPSEGSIPVSLRGKTLYNADDGKLRRRNIGGTRLAKNRLSLAWDLSVSPDGVIDGTLDIRVRNSWADMFEAISDGGKSKLYTLMAGLEGWLDETKTPEVKPLGSQGFRLVLPVHARAGIEGPQGLLAGIPSIYPAPLLTIASITDRATLKFPFVVEQRYDIQLPKGYRTMSIPMKSEVYSPVGNYESSYRINSRRNILEGEEKLIVSGTKIEADFIDSFRRVLGAWGYWRSSNLALMPRGK